jgi:hypothetical protein
VSIEDSEFSHSQDLSAKYELKEAPRVLPPAQQRIPESKVAQKLEEDFEEEDDVQADMGKGMARCSEPSHNMFALSNAFLGIVQRSDLKDGVSRCLIHGPQARGENQ